MRKLVACIIHAFRDLRGGLRHFRLLFICLSLGVMVMSCIGSTINAMKEGIERDAKSLLGGDIEIHQIYQPVAADVTAYITFNGGTFSRTADMRAMAEGKDANSDKRILAEIKGIDRNYPLYGKLKFLRQKREDIFFSNWHGGIHGAAVDQSLLDGLNIKLGDLFTVGDSTFRATAVIFHEPDRSITSFSLGPRIMVNMAAFKSTGLAKQTSMVHYRYRVKLPADVDATYWKLKMLTHYEGAFWNIRDWRDSSSRIGQQIDRLSLFFVLTAMTTLIIAGIGIGNAVSAYMWSKRNVIATMKCLGASQWHIYGMYLTELFAIATLAIAYGLLMGLGVTMLLLHYSENILPVRSEAGLYPEPMLLSAALGYLTVLLFGLIPLRQTHNIQPAALFRGYVDTSAQDKPLTSSSLLLGPLYAIIIAAMVWLAIAFTHTTRIPVYFACGLAFSLTVLYLISLGIRHIAGKWAHNGRWSFATSMALGNLSRPGAATTSVIIALGVGMSVMVALSLVSSNMRNQLDRSLPEKAPAFFFLDVQPSELTKLTAALAVEKGVQKIRALPLIRGRISKIKNIKSEEVMVDERVRWALDGTRGITFSALPPDNTVITEGEWWPADYKGAPLVSFDANLARGMGLKVGDTITVTAIDKEITGTIANLRDIPWGSLEMNFTTIFSPGSLKDLPVTYLTTVTAPPAAEKSIAAMMSDKYPSVAIIRVRKALSNISGFIGEMSSAIFLTASISLLCGALVMASAIHATLFKRQHDTVMLKVIGMTRKHIISVYLREFAIIALIASVIATIIGSAAAYGIMQLMIFTSFTVMPGIILTTLAGSLIVALGLGMIATRFVLRAKPLALLRNP